LSYYYAEAAKKLVHELGARFPAHSLMDALEMVYPQYWIADDSTENFKKHMEVLKIHYYKPRTTVKKNSNLKKRGKNNRGLQQELQLSATNVNDQVVEDSGSNVVQNQKGKGKPKS
jgi:hypothetical protein